MTYSTPQASDEPGRLSALIVYGLYLLSIPSFAVLALVGVVLAYVGREGAGPLARAHMDDQIRVWWVAVWWGAGVAALTVIGWLLTFILIGFPILFIAAGIGFIVMVWFTIKGLLGLLKLLDGRPARAS
jgi:uncharacterized membrane protein